MELLTGDENVSGTATESTEKPKLTIYLKLFLEILFLVLTLVFLWDVTQYVLRNSSEIIELSHSEVWDKASTYVEGFDPCPIILYTVLLIALILALYIIFNIFRWISGNLEKISWEIILFFVFDLFLCYLFRFKTSGERIEEYRLLLTLILVSTLGIYWLIELWERIRNWRQIGEFVKEYLKSHCWPMGILFYSLFFYIIVCFLFTKFRETETGHYAGVFLLPVIAALISVGFLSCITVIQRIADNALIVLGSLGIAIEENWKGVMGDLKKHITSLLANFLVAISSYIFLKAIISPLVPEDPPDPLTFLWKVNGTLSIILLIPLYLFFYQMASLILEGIYEELYDRLEPGGLTPLETRKIHVVNVFVNLTKIVIVIFIILNILNRFVAFEPALDFISKPPASVVIGTGLAIPLTIWLLVLVLDPFYENETIKMGPDTGRIKKVGFFFTNLETMTGEQVYIPNAELLTKTIKRLKSRKFIKEQESQKKETKKEEGEKKEVENAIILHFSCTLSYGYAPKDIEKTFKELFKRGGKASFKKYFSNAGFKIPKEKKEEKKREMNYIFSGKSHPFVFIEEFKDYGVVYRFNFRVIDSLFAPIFKGYFMTEFKKAMEKDKKVIITPVKFEIKDIGGKEFKW